MTYGGDSTRTDDGWTHSLSLSVSISLAARRKPSCSRTLPSNDLQPWISPKAALPGQSRQECPRPLRQSMSITRMLPKCCLRSLGGFSEGPLWNSGLAKAAGAVFAYASDLAALALPRFDGSSWPAKGALSQGWLYCVVFLCALERHR